MVAVPKENEVMYSFFLPQNDYRVSIDSYKIFLKKSWNFYEKEKSFNKKFLKSVCYLFISFKTKEYVC